MPADKSPAARAHGAIDDLLRTSPDGSDNSDDLKVAHAALDEALREKDQIIGLWERAFREFQEAWDNPKRSNLGAEMAAMAGLLPLSARAEGASEMVDGGGTRRPWGTVVNNRSNPRPDNPARPPSEEPEAGGGRCPDCWSDDPKRDLYNRHGSYPCPNRTFHRAAAQEGEDA